LNIFIGVTDNQWFNNLRYLKPDEVNFWQPGGKARFRALQPGELFLFKLHSPHDFIVGGGFFTHNSILPVSLAWQAFEQKNGANTLEEMRDLIGQHRQSTEKYKDYDIGCIILTQPFFWEQDKWLQVPSDWKTNIVQGKTYDISSTIGKRLSDEVQTRLQARPDLFAQPKSNKHKDRYGPESTYRPRLGQGAFRVIVTDAYRRRCAVTQERVLPTLEAAHIKPYAESGPHAIGNGILLRSDIHHLLDHGYVSISPDYHFEVSKEIKEDFDNGEEYNKLHGQRLYLPANRLERPDPEFIKWHNEHSYKG
jgi:putative restriction endonuclease